MVRQKSEPPRGVLNSREGSKHFQLFRYHPSTELAYFVEHYWIVHWDLRGKDPFHQDVLSHPVVHLVFQQEGTRIWGVVTGKFTRTLEGRGKVLGIKFRPGGFYPFVGKPISSFTDGLLPFSEVFDEDLENLQSEILGHNENEGMVATAEAFLLRNLPEKDPAVDEVSQLVECIRQEASILKVDDLTERISYSKRTLQRIFRKYVGISPKWVIQRYRLHEAAEKIAAGKAENWSELALELGYFDQAHFIRDFKSIVGQTPAEYVRDDKG